MKLELNCYYKIKPKYHQNAMHWYVLKGAAYEELLHKKLYNLIKEPHLPIFELIHQDKIKCYFYNEKEDYTLPLNNMCEEYFEPYKQPINYNSFWAQLNEI